MSLDADDLTLVTQDLLHTYQTWANRERRSAVEKAKLRVQIIELLQRGCDRAAGSGAAPRV